MIGLLLPPLLAVDPQTLTGNVVRVTDGDTLLVLDASNHQEKI